MARCCSRVSRLSISLRSIPPDEDGLDLWTKAGGLVNFSRPIAKINCRYRTSDLYFSSLSYLLGYLPSAATPQS
jgi:hypothetical protein